MKQELGRVLGSKYDEDGFLCVQIQPFGSKSVGWFELSSTDGTQSRPLDPDDSGACQAYYWWDGSRGYCTLANDPRTQGLLPQSQKGEKFFFGPTGAFMRFKLDGSISMFTTNDNTVNGRSVSLQVSPKGLLFSFPYGRLTFDDTGFHVEHNSGAYLDLGAIGGLPTPLDVVSSYVSLGAATFNAEAAAVCLGPGAGQAQPHAKATATLATLQSMMAATQSLTLAVEGLAAALATIGGLTTSPPAASAASTTAAALVATAQGVVAAAQTAVAAALLTIPSLSTASP